MISDIMESYLNSDIEWFAVDCDGHIGVFFTAGIAPVPRTVIDHFSDCDEPLGKTFRKKPLRYKGDFTSHASYLIKPASMKPVAFSCFLDFPKLGIWVYDWLDEQRYPQTYSYELLTSPTAPLLVSDLPTELQSFLKMRSLPIRFSESKFVRIEDYLEIIK